MQHNQLGGTFSTFLIIIALKTTLGFECDHAVLHRCNVVLFVEGDIRDLRCCGGLKPYGVRCLYCKSTVYGETKLSAVYPFS